MKTVKAPNFEEGLAESFMQFANAQPEVAAFVVLFVIAACAKALTSLTG